MFVKIPKKKIFVRLENLRPNRNNLRTNKNNFRPNKYNFRENPRIKNIFVLTFGNFIRYEDHSIPNFTNTEYSCSYEEHSMPPQMPSIKCFGDLAAETSLPLQPACGKNKPGSRKMMTGAKWRRSGRWLRMIWYKNSLWQRQK